jgi:2-C-methyl-D-erythritol 4-phosphate cytidylyltransferase
MQKKAIILMAGEGLRFGAKIPKQFIRLSGKKIYLHTLDAFLAARFFDQIFLVCHHDYIDTVRKEVHSKGNHVHVISGGATRQESTFLGLQAAAPCDIIMVHDAVRPFVSQEIIKNNIDATIKFGAANTCIPSTDTLVKIKNGAVSNIPLRDHWRRGQTPQTFRFAHLKKAHELATQTSSTDDCQLLLDQGYPVKEVSGSEYNIKITTELDLFIAEQILRQKTTLICKKGQSINLSDQIYVVTGGTGGIGREICSQLEAAGATVLPVSRSAKPYSVDLQNPAATKAVFQQIFKEHGFIHGLINASGYLKRDFFQQTSITEINQTIGANFHAIIYACRFAKIKKGGHIINLSSSSYIAGRKSYAVYSATKAAIVNFSQGLAEERPDLLINTVIPCRTNTNLRNANFPQENPETLLHPKKIADEVLRIVSSKNQTGIIFEVR